MSHEETTEIELAISGMTCASCSMRIEKKLNKLPDVQAHVNLATHKAHITTTRASKEELITCVQKAGYNAFSLTDEHNELLDPDIERMNTLKVRLILSLVISVPVITLSMTPQLHFPTWQYWVGVLSLIVTIWGGWPFHKSAFNALRHGSTTMDTLVSLGAFSALFFSLWNLFFTHARHLDYEMHMNGLHATQGAHLYFESATTIITFLLLGRYLEARSRYTTKNGLRELMNHEATYARKILEDGSETVCHPYSIIKGDVCRIKPHEVIPCDGHIIKGKTSIDASLITGESLPISVNVGSNVTGGTLNIDETIDIKVDRSGSDTTLSSMVSMLQEVQASKAPIQSLADKVSSFFIPFVIAISIINFLLHFFLLSHSLHISLTSTITILVVACPCALGLATPTALLVGTSRASKQGIFIKNAAALESIHKVDTFIFDKTGTLTQGKLSLTHISRYNTDTHQLTELPLNNTVHTYIALASSVEYHSLHPLAQCLLEYARTHNINTYDAHKIHSHIGKGIEGIANNRHIRIGNAEYITHVPHHIFEELEKYGTTVCMSVDDKEFIFFSFSDTLRSDSSLLISELKSRGITPLIASGDSEQMTQKVAHDLGISQAYSQQKPEDKLYLLRDLQTHGHIVAMVGDGVNDAGALAGADISFTLDGATSTAKETADITIMHARISGIIDAIDISQATLRTIKENLLWAFSYNFLAIPLAITGFIAPGIAAGAMAFSSVFVVLNSLRLRKQPAHKHFRKKK
ncbi:MAG: cadmium-translocating P-type ATPase [Actinomycetaceae bacterium]|nr:cadmium-translocating P-type ATPase [Actinomycetaceae bacterium]